MSDSSDTIKPSIDGNIAWYDVRQWGVEGRAWNNTGRYFCRLPADAKKKVQQGVWNLSQHTSGISANFSTDSTSIWTRYRLLLGDIPALLTRIATMTSASVNGLDLYAKDEENELRWLGVAIPKKGPLVECKLACGIDPGMRDYTAYLPLHNGVESLEIGVTKTANFNPIFPRSAKPIVFYGTSITHGCCASRPGMAYPAILGRRLKHPVVNLGFAGLGVMEEAIASLMGQIDAAVYVVDCLPNMNACLVNKNAKPFLRILQKTRPEVPVILMEDRSWANSPFIGEHRHRHKSNQTALRRIYEDLHSCGMNNIVYLKGNNLLGTDGEATVDGSHPSDLGMMRLADALEPTLRSLLKNE